MLKKGFIGQKKYIIIHTLTLIFVICGLFLLNKTFAQDCEGGDLMQQAFCTAKSYDTILDMGETKDGVGNNILRESAAVEIEDNFGVGCFMNGQFVGNDESLCVEMGGEWGSDLISINTKEPLIVRITKFLLRMTIVLSISMVIFNSILYMIEVMSGKDRKSAEAKNNIAWVAGGLIIALMSVGIINLVISVPKSSLKTSDDMGSFEIGCQTGGTIVAGSNLKEWICLNSTFGHDEASMSERVWNPTRPINRCYICEQGNTGCDWESITNSEMQSKCVEDMGGVVIDN